MVIERIVARAWLQDPEEEVDRVRGEVLRGDESWGRWLDELERGDAVVAGMQVEVHVRLSDGSSRTAQAENHHLWLEVATHPPMLEAQIQEIAGKDFEALAERLREFGDGDGAGVTAYALSNMYVHVELSSELRTANRRSDPAEQAIAPTAREGLGTETGRHVTHLGSARRQ
jgi:hypothetical protein